MVQSDGKIVVVGTSDDLSSTALVVAGFNIDGSPDNSFGTDGSVITKSSLTGRDLGSGIALQSDDKIVVVGSGDDENGVLEFVVARFNADGSFTFPNSFGKATTSFSAGDDVGAGIAVQSKDKIVVVGTRDDGSGTSEFAVARYLPDLSFSFNGGGGGSSGSCFIATTAYATAYGSPKIGFVPTMAFMLLSGSGFIGFVWSRRKYKE